MQKDKNKDFTKNLRHQGADTSRHHEERPPARNPKKKNSAREKL